MSATTNLPAMPVDRDELIYMLDALEQNDLTVTERVKLGSVLSVLNQFDREPDDDDREGRRIDHATNWRVTRQRWREFVVAWRADHSLSETTTP